MVDLQMQPLYRNLHQSQVRASIIIDACNLHTSGSSRRVRSGGDFDNATHGLPIDNLQLPYQLQLGLVITTNPSSAQQTGTNLGLQPRHNSRTVTTCRARKPLVRMVNEGWLQRSWTPVDTEGDTTPCQYCWLTLQFAS